MQLAAVVLVAVIVLQLIRQLGGIVEGHTDIVEGHTGIVRALAISSDGSIVVSGSGAHHFCLQSDNTVRVWNTNTGQVAAMR